MARPSLTPITYCEFDRPGEQLLARLRANLTRLMRTSLRRLARGVSRAVTTDLGSAGMRKTLPMRVVTIGILMKLAWLPPAVVVACGWAVYRGTHGPAVAAAQVARVSNAFSERVSFAAADGVGLSAVWVPAVTAEEIVGQGETVLGRRDAAVVLVHDHGHDAGQMLAQATLLHELGLHVLVLDTRGSGQSEPAARTFGRMEQLDVAAAVNYLASRASVDKARIAVWGVGSGAAAGERASASVPIALLLAEREFPAGSVASTDDRFMPAHAAYDALRPVCRWLFHVLYAGGADLSQGRPGRIVEVKVGHLEGALAELRSFASEHLVAQAG